MATIHETYEEFAALLNSVGLNVQDLLASEKDYPHTKRILRPRTGCSISTSSMTMEFGVLVLSRAGSAATMSATEKARPTSSISAARHANITYRKHNEAQRDTIILLTHWVRALDTSRVPVLGLTDFSLPSVSKNTLNNIPHPSVKMADQFDITTAERSLGIAPDAHGSMTFKQVAETIEHLLSMQVSPVMPRHAFGSV